MNELAQDRPTPRVMDDSRVPSLLPFAFARRFGVVITEKAGPDGQTIVACKTQPTLTTLAEIKRYARRTLQVSMVAEGEFEALLTETYARDASHARQMVEDMGDELDLASLADFVPETEDLLEQEDDAPIIRLINALLAEAIRENASDIHIETFEKDLVVRFRIDGGHARGRTPQTATRAFAGVADKSHGPA